MESGFDRFPRRSGLCVLFHADQFLVIGVGPRTSRIRRRSGRNSMEDMHMWRRRSFWIGSQCKRRCHDGSFFPIMNVTDVLS